MSLEKKPEEEDSDSEAGAGAYSGDAEVEEHGGGEGEELPSVNRSLSSQFASQRQQLTAPLNLRTFLETGEAEFELLKAKCDPCSTSDQNNENSKKSVFEGCDFRNLKVQHETETEEDENLVLGDFSAIRALMQNVTKDGGLMKKVDRAGLKGELPPPNAKVLIHYTAMCENWDEPLDDQFERRKKIKQFRLGRGDVISALDIAVASMEKKERAKFLSTPEYAYGKLGVPDVVPPDATILFTLELVEFFDQPASAITNEEGKAKASFDLIEKTANQYKLEGNRHYNHEDYARAFSRYTKGVKILERHLTLDKYEDKRRNDLLFILYSNMAQTCLLDQQFEEAVELCEKALDLPPNTEGKKIKVYLRYAQAQTELGRYETAKGILRDARKLEPGNFEVRSLDEKVSEKMKGDKATEEQLARKMFADWKLNP